MNTADYLIVFIDGWGAVYKNLMSVHLYVKYKMLYIPIYKFRRKKMGFIDRLESKIGRFAIRNLMLYLIIIYAFGFVVYSINPDYYILNLSLNFAAIFQGEVWRLVTFLCFPPSTNVALFLLYSFIYYSLGRSLESYWGAFRFNLYIFLGIFGEILAALIIYLAFGEVYLLTAGNLYMSMLLGIAITVPEARFMIYFIIPVKAKWLGIFYGVLLVIQAVISDWPGRIELVLSLLNFIVFFFFIRRPVSKTRSKMRKAEYVIKMKRGEMENKPAGYRHRCSVCGITDRDDPNMEFRYCSQCDGAHEYCMNHLYTHIHVHSDSKS